MKKTFLLRIAALPKGIQKILWDDLMETIENRIKTMERLVEVKGREK